MITDDIVINKLNNETQTSVKTKNFGSYYKPTCNDININTNIIENINE